MADKKISQLTALSAANLAPSTDVLAIVDTSATETKKIVAQDLINGVLNVASAVGIGTASPGSFSGSVKLVVGSAATTTTPGAVTVYSGNATYGGLYFADGTVGNQLYRGAVEYNHSTDTLLLYSAGSSNVFLDSSGNLGLGVTPSAWVAGAEALQVNGVSISESSLGAEFSYNTYRTAASTWNAIATGGAARYGQAGDHRWYVGSGTAGNAITFTQAMTLDASGRLGIGTTSPAATLDIGSGNVYVRTGITYSNTISPYSGDLTIDYGSSPNVLKFSTGATERGRFTAGGNLLVNKTTAEYGKFEVSSAEIWVSYFVNTKASGDTRGLRVSYSAASPNNTADWFLYCEDSTTQRASIRSNGGLANYQSNNVDLSDARTKNSITPAASMWDKIGALEIVTYKYNDQTHDDVNVGVIAQQVESVEPVWVDADGFGETPEGEEPLKTVYTKDITFAAIKALQEAMARIESLEADVAALKGAK